MASKINLISNALILIGDLPITSLTGNTRAQTVANNLYEPQFPRRSFWKQSQPNSLAT